MVLKYLKKGFSSYRAKINFIPKPEKLSYLNYFGNEQILQNKFSSPILKRDLIKNKMISVYQDGFPKDFDKNYEKINFISVKEDLEEVREISIKTAQYLKIFKKIFIEFSPEITLPMRKIILNTFVQSNYAYSQKTIPEKKENQTEQEYNELKKKKPIIEEINIIEDEISQKNKDELNYWINLAKSNLFTRTLANRKSNPKKMESRAKKIIKSLNNPNVSIEVIKGKELEEKGLNLLHSVGKGAESSPRLILLTYKGDSEKEEFEYSVVGKGITFDTGGLNLKPTGFIENMYLDKCGAASTLSIFKHTVENKLKLNLVCVLALAENAIDSKSYKPSDIIKSLKGKTVEITNTDAEGRLVLADAFTYVQNKYKPKYLIDLATLTGACYVGLGKERAGLFSNDYDLADRINQSSEEVFEKLWHLPITSEHRESLNSQVSDIKNADRNRYGGASKAAAFLEYFVEEGTKWAHIDMYGPSISEANSGIKSFGATGFGTQIILHFLNQEILKKNSEKILKEEENSNKNEEKVEEKIEIKNDLETEKDKVIVENVQEGAKDVIEESIKIEGLKENDVNTINSDESKSVENQNTVNDITNDTVKV